MTQQQLADKARISRTDINAMVNGRLEVGPERLQRLAKALRVKPEALGARAAEADAAALLLLDRLPEVEARLSDLEQTLGRFVEGTLARLAVLEEARAQAERQRDRGRKAAS
jgi:transcriptional regulator with XRE-family HTH domain